MCSQRLDEMRDKVPLSQIADVLGGFAFKSEDFNAAGIPVVRIANIEPPHVNFSESARIPESKVVGLDRFRLRDRDIVMAMTGATIGKVGRIHSTTRAYLNQRVAKISAKAGCEFDDFVWAVVSQKGFDEEVLNNAGGSAQANVSAGGIGRIQIPSFSRDEQRQIGKVIRALDDKIELNRRMNRTLEELATRLFRSWCVDFDPVVAKAAGRKPVHLRPEIAALFPAHFQDSELGPIPHGSEVKSVEDLAQYVNGRAFTKGASGKGRMVVRIAELNSGPGGSTIYTDIDAAPEHVGNRVICSLRGLVRSMCIAGIAMRRSSTSIYSKWSAKNIRNGSCISSYARRCHFSKTSRRIKPRQWVTSNASIYRKLVSQSRQKSCSKLLTKSFGRYTTNSSLTSANH
jgi:restriction endonuclease S subunit